MLSWDESSIYHAERKVTAVRFSKWHIAPEKPEAQACLRAAGYPYLVAAVLSARGIETPEQAAAFLEREDKLTISPFLMRDMDKAAARVQQAIAGGERIAVFGDYDVDGITALPYWWTICAAAAPRSATISPGASRTATVSPQTP